MRADDLWLRGDWLVNEVFRYTDGKLLRVRFPPHALEAKLSEECPNPVADPYGLYTIYRDRSGALWFGTADRGVFRFDGKHLSWLYLDHLTNAPNGGSFGIRAILEDHAGNFWLCNTRSRFVILPHVADDPFFCPLRFEERPGIPSVVTADGSNRLYFQSIVEDAAHHLWMLTYRDGIWRYDGKSLKQYWVRDGATPIDLYSLSQERHADDVRRCSRAPQPGERRPSS